MPLLFAGLLIALLVAPASAEPPTGFAEFPWGTEPSVLRDRFLSKRCRSSSESREPWYSITCLGYLVEGLSVPVLRLDFEPGASLAGYYMVIAPGSYPALRDLVIKRFGRPTSRARVFWSGAHLSWAWPGMSATMIERCGEEASCLEVTTAPIERRREQLRERERRDSAQSF